MTPLPAFVSNSSSQRLSRGRSNTAIVDGVIAWSEPRAGLSWLDIGCGTGEVLRVVRDHFAPARLTGADLVDWLAEDLREDVTFINKPAEMAVADLEPADRVCLVECLDDLEGPWAVLRAAARLVTPGGHILITFPHIANLRHRLELVARGQLTAYRPDNLPQRTPVLPHIVRNILIEEGLVADPHGFLGTDVVPLTGGREWPATLRRWLPSLTSISVIIRASRPD